MIELGNLFTMTSDKEPVPTLLGCPLHHAWPKLRHPSSGILSPENPSYLAFPTRPIVTDVRTYAQFFHSVWRAYTIHCSALPPSSRTVEH